MSNVRHPRLPHGRHPRTVTSGDHKTWDSAMPRWLSEAPRMRGLSQWARLVCCANRLSHMVGRRLSSVPGRGLGRRRGQRATVAHRQPASRVMRTLPAELDHV